MQKMNPAPLNGSAPASQIGAAPQGASDDEWHGLAPILLQYWQAVIRWRLLIAGIIIACLVAGTIMTMLKPPLFTARSQIEISREQKNITNVPGIDQGSGYYDAEFYDTQYALMRVRSLAERVARNLKLTDNPAFFAAHGVELPKTGAAASAALSSSERKAREDMAAGLLLGGIAIQPVQNSSLVDITYTSRSPEWSEKIANAWPEGFIGATIDRQFASSADARRYLEERLASLRGKLEQSEHALITFGNEHNIVPLGGSRDANGRTEQPRTLVASNLEALNAALIQARTERIAAESRARTRAGENSPEVLANGVISGLRAKRAEIASDYARLLVQFEPSYPSARAIKRQMDALDTAIANETARISGSRQASYNEALQRENELAAQVEALKGQFDQQQRDTIQYTIYQREVDTNRQLYDALLQRYKEIGVAGSVGATNVVIVEKALRPGGQSSPNLTLNLMIALLAGLALSAAAVFALEQIDEGIRNPADVEKLLRLPLLGNVPLTDGKPEAKLADPKSPLSEAYFSVRTTLALATSHGLPRTLAVTSAQPGEGKSLTSLALASTIGRTGRRVLLIDGDMRSPSVHKLVGGDNARGFSNILAGEDNYASLIRETGLKGVSALPAGPTPPSAAELLSSDRLDQILETLLTRFDHIVIDAPPVIGLADAPLIGRAVEGCVFVIEAERVAVRTIRSALQRLQVGQNHVYGGIVTKVDFSRHSYGYGYGYGHGYGYSYGHDGAEKNGAAG